MPADREMELSAWGSRQRALARWENEGGALGAQRHGPATGYTDEELPPLADAELMQLHSRARTARDDGERNESRNGKHCADGIA